jgi:hypothetical protein
VDTDGYPSREDRIVAEFGDGHDVEGIALRYGLTVEQVYAVIEREVGPTNQGPANPAAQWPAPGPYPPPAQYPVPGQYPPAQYPPPGYYYGPPPPATYYAPPGQGYYGPPTYQAPPPGFPPPPPGFLPPLPDEDAIVADYGDGYDVESIARKHGITPEHVYDVVRRVVGDDE